MEPGRLGVMCMRDREGGVDVLVMFVRWGASSVWEGSHGGRIASFVCLLKLITRGEEWRTA